MKTKGSIEARAKEASRVFNTAEIPELCSHKMEKYLKSINVHYYTHIMMKRYRDGFFDIAEKSNANRRPLVIYSKKKEPVHFSKFAQIIMDIHKCNSEKANSKEKAETYKTNPKK
jgi:hypothetical protein